MLVTLDSLPSNGIQMAEWRIERGLTQRQLAEIIGSTQRTVSEIELSGRTLHRIARERLLQWCNDPTFRASSPLPRRERGVTRTVILPDGTTAQRQVIMPKNLR